MEVRRYVPPATSTVSSEDIGNLIMKKLRIFMDRPVGLANIQNQLILGTLQCDFTTVQALFVILQENGKGWAKAKKEKLTAA